MLLIRARDHDLGDFVVRRLLPIAGRRNVGPFVFFDHMGPAQFPPGGAIAVRPHPHIGLATLTFLFEGQLLHRDSLGTTQTIDPWAVNWMIAGRGITHSERVTDEIRAAGQRIEGLQLWVALPQSHEEMAPEFHHYPAAQMPHWQEGGAEFRLFAGSAFGRQSPVLVFSPMMALDVRLAAGASLDLPGDYAEKAVYALDGAISVDDQPIGLHEMAAFSESELVRITAQSDSHLVVIGGERLDAPRTMFWNFVSSRPERLEQAKEDWRAGRFAKIPGDEIEFIPLPE